ncbi:hypothetical protein JTB14_007885 [Gonioctena quinquepunctata]|nr:hypothetical protein JTB14_007885 [Gonioctena quinquepunctata]
MDIVTSFEFPELMTKIMVHRGYSVSKIDQAIMMALSLATTVSGNAAAVHKYPETDLETAASGFSSIFSSFSGGGFKSGFNSGGNNGWKKGLNSGNNNGFKSGLFGGLAMV